MCILCVVQRWSRRIATLLPWLLIPLLLFWAMSPFLPPGLRFEVTSPRLACVMVLLVTLFWYEILMPQLSLWRTRRSARLRERRRALAIEMQKLRKTATRSCRNCHTPYRDQNPGGGRFMCSYCGHVSKRPVLDLPRSVGSSGVNDLVGKNGWMCSQDWSAEGGRNWVNPLPHYWLRDDQCLMERSCSSVVLFPCKLLSCFLASLNWLCQKVFRFSLREDGSDAVHRGSSNKRGDNGGNLQQNRWERVRRKAEEKRQAKLEKEMLEEEERKQREEVAKLVEERRRIRDEMLKAEKELSESNAADRERENRKVAEKGRHERRKDKDKGSSKSNSDVEDIDKRISKEGERKHEFDKKYENERRDSVKTATEIHKSYASGTLHGNKATASKPRYFSRMTDNFLSSSRGLSGASFFGRNTQIPTTVNKVSKPTIGFMDHVSENKRDSQVAGDKMVKATLNGDSKVQVANIHQPPGQVAPRRTWHQLFTYSAAVCPYPDTTTSTLQNVNSQLEAQSAQLVNQKLPPNYSVDSQNNVGPPLPFTAYCSVASASEAFSSSSVSSLSAELLFPSAKDPELRSIADEAELFEDPCYVPDPISLLGPVSESLDNFPLDLGAGFLSGDKVEPQVLKSVSASGNISKPSPIESPISRLRVSDEKQTVLGQASCNSSSQDSHPVNANASHGTWQMWGTPLAQDGLGLGGPSSWFLPIGQKNLKQEVTEFPFPHNSMASLSEKESPTLLGIQSSLHVCDAKHQNGDTYSFLGARMNISNHLMQKSPLQSLPGDGESLSLPPSLIDTMQHSDSTHSSPNRSSADCHFELSPANCWFSDRGLLDLGRMEWALNDPQQDGKSTLANPNVEGLFSASPYTESVWSFSQKETV
ncbi:hypothetical protein OPV22_009913 [Ensete ventricosum]|uniref:Uncharacterized protein n=1 Tax=Ensete ventricosum TaxID=4639 RepID=A0AAV8RJM0_ENSVE|nr:hypothetical protein OPV22_009913 [Ensete ventricosum]